MEFAEWSVQHGAGMELSKLPGSVPRAGGQRSALNTEVMAMSKNDLYPIYMERSTKGDTTTEFYFRAKGFVVPVNQKREEFAVWTGGQRADEGVNKFYTFGPQRAFFTTNTGEVELAIICIK